MKTGIVIPVMVKALDTLRFRNFCHVVRTVVDAGHGSDLIVCQQVGGPSLDVSHVVASLAPSSRVLTLAETDPRVHKSRLINMAMEQFDTEGRAYTLMVDADIHMDIKGVMAAMETLNPDEVQAVKPFRFFIRLNLDDSEKVRHGKEVVANTADYLDKEIVHYPAAGAWGFSHAACHRVGRMDETFVGWGWEDTEFSMRIRKHCSWKVLPGAGFHLEHENDRVINGANFEKFSQRGNSTTKWSEMAIHVRRKVCIMSAGRGGSTALAKGLASHPDIDMFESDDPRPEVKGTTEIFDPIHFSTEFPAVWNGESILRFIAQKFLMSSGSNYIGFKLMMGQPDPVSTSRIIGYIAGQPANYRTILVTRDNLFEQGLSYCIATQTGQWVGNYPEKLKVKVSLAELSAYVRASLTFNALVVAKVSNVLVVPFESIRDDWQRTARVVLHRLDLAQRELTHRIQPQRKAGRTLESMVSNSRGLIRAWPEEERKIRQEVEGLAAVEAKIEATKGAILAGK